MKIIHEKFFVNIGEFVDSEEFVTILTQLKEAINEVTWYSDTEFIINPTIKGNGVVPIKSAFIDKLKEDGWKDEVRMSLVKGVRPGPIDVIKKTTKGIFAAEWETGNVSSSHRALNKIAVGIIQGQIIGGIVVLPVKKFAKYLTDRIGNYEELAPYFPMYEHFQIEHGIIGVIAIEHDKEDPNAPLIPKRKDGNAKK